MKHIIQMDKSDQFKWEISEEDKEKFFDLTHLPRSLIPNYNNLVSDELA